jgi:ATP synthase protein I
MTNEPTRNPDSDSDRRVAREGDSSSRGRTKKSPAGVPQPGVPVDLSREAKAAQAIADRSRSEGIWSLGHLKLCLTALIAGGLVLGIVGGLVSGLGAVLGVTMGTVIVGVFFTFSAVVIAWVGKTNPKTVMVAALFAYVIKVLVLGIVLATMPIDGPIDVKWMAGAIGLGLFLWLGAHMRYVWTLKLYYVDPG